jgi:hypothetical protein
MAWTSVVIGFLVLVCIVAGLHLFYVTATQDDDKHDGHAS